ncbi:MAG: hypothetical protein WBK97_05740 [Bacteroidales bacterium]|jgi:ElaB/YqjD/DUF883 family membrane-anchored ribosome-binding protein
MGKDVFKMINDAMTEVQSVIDELDELTKKDSQKPTEPAEPQETKIGGITMSEVMKVRHARRAKESAYKQPAIRGLDDEQPSVIKGLKK